jgi:hypothetical protein
MTTKSIFPCPEGTIGEACGDDAFIEVIADSAEEEEREVM